MFKGKQPYWFNKATGKTQWTRPAEVGEQSAAAYAAAAAAEPRTVQVRNAIRAQQRRRQGGGQGLGVVAGSAPAKGQV